MYLHRLCINYSQTVQFWYIDMPDVAISCYGRLFDWLQFIRIEVAAAEINWRLALSQLESAKLRELLWISVFITGKIILKGTFWSFSLYKYFCHFNKVGRYSLSILLHKESTREVSLNTLLLYQVYPFKVTHVLLVI